MTSAAPPKPKRDKLIRQSGSSSIAALAAMLSGLALDVVLALRFGAGHESDAFFVAARVPIGLAALLMTVALQSLVPLFTRDRAVGGTASVTQFASRVFTGAFLLGAVIWLAAALLARPLVDLTAPGLTGSGQALAASVVPVMFLVVPLVAAAEVVRAALNATYAFVIPAGMNLSMNAVTATIVFVSGGHDVRTCSWAYVAGASVQLVAILAYAWSRGVRIRPSIHLRDPRVTAAFRLSGRPTVSGLLNLGNRVAEQLLASFLPTGSITILSYGQRLISALGGGVFFRPVTVALIPRLADAEQRGDHATTSALVVRGLKFVLTISCVLTAFTVALAHPVITLVFHRGNFTPTATYLLAVTLAIYGASLVGSGVQRVLLAPFFARLDTRLPLRNTLLGVIVDLALLVPCVAVFHDDQNHGVLGVAIAYSLTQYVIVWHAWHRLGRTVPLPLARLAPLALRVGAASAAGTIAMLVLVRALHLSAGTGRLRLLLVTAGITVVGALVMALVFAMVMGATMRFDVLKRLGLASSGRHRHNPRVRDDKRSRLDGDVSTYAAESQPPIVLESRHGVSAHKVGS